MIVVLMGVAGVGKSAVGRQVAARLGAEFHDADDHHPPASVEKMRAGLPLTEADRSPWLAALNALLKDCTRRGVGAVLACSALTRAHRAALLEGVPDAVLVHLTASREVIRQRLEARSGHFFAAELLESQLALLEPPEPEQALVVDTGADLQGVVEELTRAASRALRAHGAADG